MPTQATDKVCMQDKTTRDTKKHKPNRRWTEGKNPNVVILFHRSITADKLLVSTPLSFCSFQTVGYFQTRVELSSADLLNLKHILTKILFYSLYTRTSSSQHFVFRSVY